MQGNFELKTKGFQICYVCKREFLLKTNIFLCVKILGILHMYDIENHKSVWLNSLWTEEAISCWKHTFAFFLTAIYQQNIWNISTIYQWYISNISTVLIQHFLKKKLLLKSFPDRVVLPSTDIEFSCILKLFKARFRFIKFLLVFF